METSILFVRIFIWVGAVVTKNNYELSPGDSKNMEIVKNVSPHIIQLFFLRHSNKFKTNGGIIFVQISIWVGAPMAKNNYKLSPERNKKCESTHNNSFLLRNN